MKKPTINNSLSALDGCSCTSSTAHSGHNNKASVRSDELLDNTGQLLIEHLGEHYCLRLTRQNKLILTK